MAHFGHHHLRRALGGNELLLQSRDAFGASVAGWWLGQNFLDIAPYIGDANVRTPEYKGFLVNVEKA